MDDETWLNAEKALQLGFVDGILFDDKKKASVPEEDKPDEDEEKKDFSALYSQTRTATSLMQKLSALAPVKGVPIDQLEKRLNLLKY